MYVLNRYSVKQPQNIIKIKIKWYGIGKKEFWKKVEWNMYCLYFAYGSVCCSAFFLPQEKLFS